MPPAPKRLIRSDLRPAEFIQRKKKARKRVFFLFFISLVLFAAAVAGVLSINHLRIQNIEVRGTKVIDSEDISSFVASEISGRYAYVIPKDSLLLYKKLHLPDVLMNAYPRALQISTDIESRTTLVVTVRERGGRYLWCGEMMVTGDEKCYFVDSNGFVFSESPYFSQNVYLKIYGTLQDKKEGIVGSIVIQKEEFEKLMQFRNALLDHGIQTTTLILKDDGDAHFLLPGESNSRRPVVYISRSEDVAQAITNIITALENEPLRTRIKTNIENLEYLDVRYENKVFYKFTGDTEGQ